MILRIGCGSPARVSVHLKHDLNFPHDSKIYQIIAFGSRILMGQHETIGS
jgi:hypothetical protein